MTFAPYWLMPAPWPLPETVKRKLRPVHARRKFAERSEKIERIFAIATPTIVSLTRADNNTIQNMSDLNFYVFADEIDCQGADITSRCGMIAIMETLLYKRLSADSSTIIV